MYQIKMKKKTVLLDDRCFSTYQHGLLPDSRLFKYNFNTTRKSNFPIFWGHPEDIIKGKNGSSDSWTLVALFCLGLHFAMCPWTYESEDYVGGTVKVMTPKWSSRWMSYWRRETEWRLLEPSRTAMWYALPVYYDFGWGTSLTLSKWHEAPNCFTRNLIQTPQLCYHPSWGKSYFCKNNI